MTDLTRDDLWDLVDGLDDLPSSRELEVEQLMQCAITDTMNGGAT